MFMCEATAKHSENYYFSQNIQLSSQIDGSIATQCEQNTLSRCVENAFMIYSNSIKLIDSIESETTVE